MSILGIGTDIVEMVRLEEAFARHGDHFKKRILTDAEQQLAADRNQAVSFYAGRWAAKEACAKALGCGIGQNCSFTDIEVLNNVSGKPEIILHGNGKATFEKIGGKKILLSISHERHYAVATVIIE